MNRLNPSRLSRTGRALAVALSTAVTLAQLIALSHEAGVRHVRCAEHGELTHVASVPAEVALSFRPAHAAWRRGALETPDAHEHCAGAFTVQSSTASPLIRADLRRPAPDVRHAPPPGPTFRREPRSLLAAAPKTSPPRSRRA